MCAVQVLYAEGEGGEGVAGSKPYAKIAEGAEAWTQVGKGRSKLGGELGNADLAAVLAECNVLLRLFNFFFLFLSEKSSNLSSAPRPLVSRRYDRAKLSIRFEFRI